MVIYLRGGLNIYMQYAPTIQNPSKTIMSLDNASHHRKDAIYDIADKFGFRVIFLPKYSPDLNKTEKTWANIKNWLRLHLYKFISIKANLLNCLMKDSILCDVLYSL